MSETQDISAGSKTFGLGAVLTVTTGKFLTDDMGDLYDILNHMTGDNLFTHQLVRAGDVCQEPLLAQHPQLRAVEVPKLAGGDEYKAWLVIQEKLFGAELRVERLESWQHKDPIAELSEMTNGTKPIIGVVVDDEVQP